MKVLGVDPGLVRTGWATVEADGSGYRLLGTGLIAPPPEGELAERLAEGYTRFAVVLDEVRPDVMVLEDIFSVPQHPRAAIMMAHMRGVLCLAAGQRGLRVEPMTASTVKQRVTGNGRASKVQVQEMVFRLCGIHPREMRADISDAIALAVAGLNQMESGGGGREAGAGTWAPRRGSSRYPEHLLERVVHTSQLPIPTPAAKRP